MQILLRNKLRSLYFIIPLFVFYVVIILRLFFLTFEQSFVLNKTIKSNVTTPDILDRNGMVIATNVPTTSIYINPNKIKNMKSTVAQLCSFFSDLECNKLLESKKNFVWVKRHLTPQELLAIKTEGIPGISFYNDTKRIYPHNNLFSHVLGYTDIDGKGIAGIEYYISGVEHIKLSLDLRIQNIVYDELNKAVKKYRAIGGVGIILNVKNGEIISMVSLPDFNPNMLYRSTEVQRFNRASLGVYEMGSVFKLFTIAAALDANAVTLDNTYDVSKPITIEKFKIYDFHKSKAAKITTQDVFIRSSNIGVAKIALDLGIEKQVEYFRTMKLFSPLKIEIPEKSVPIFPHKWSKSTLITASYGYGIAVTPMHIVQTAAALVNDGIFHHVTLMLGKESVGEKIISDRTSHEIRKLMRMTVTDGTGKKANIKGFSVGGKTGSAEKSIGGKYDKNANMVSFIGVVTALDPRYVVFIAIDEPQGMQSSTGGLIAAPVVRSIINRTAPILNIIPEAKLFP